MRCTSTLYKYVLFAVLEQGTAVLILLGTYSVSNIHKFKNRKVNIFIVELLSLRTDVLSSDIRARLALDNNVSCKNVFI